MKINDKTTLHFDDSFFKEEVVCGFKVTEKLKKIRAIELDLIHQLTDVCNKYNLKFFVFAGTLLGAVRHRGFIPWDDDFDVIMTREDFKKLQEVAEKEFRHPYFLQSSLSDKQYFFGYGRLRNSLTTGHILGYKSSNYNEGIYVDVYVADGCVNDDRLLKRQLKKLDFILKIINLYKKNNESGSRAKKAIKALLIVICTCTLSKILKYDRLEMWYEKEISRYTDSSEMLSTITHGFSIARRAEFNKDEFNNIVYVPFENISVPIPAGYDKMLTRMYGNYMEFPSEGARGDWHNNIIHFDPDMSYVEYFQRKQAHGANKDN